ncbi:MAG: type II toxin-antitoxin system mRNA interferase toxin, RelE/StbE family [Nanoarchaeota archaeon]
MYEITTRNKKIKEELEKYISIREGISDKLKRLKENPRREIGAHPLHGKLKGKWGCWLGSNIRMIYEINESEKMIIVDAVGSHKIY